MYVDVDIHPLSSSIINHPSIHFHLFIHSFIDPSMHSLIHPFIHSFFHSFTGRLANEARALRTPLMERDQQLIVNGFLKQSHEDYLLLRDQCMTEAQKAAAAKKKKGRKKGKKGKKIGKYRCCRCHYSGLFDEINSFFLSAEFCRLVPTVGGKKKPTEKPKKGAKVLTYEENLGACLGNSV